MENLSSLPLVTAQMKIRKPVAIVFNAMIDPDITTKFWFSKSSGKPEAGKPVYWEWEIYGAKAKADILEIIPEKKFSFSWGEPATLVVFSFEKLDEANTYITIENSGFLSEGAALAAEINDNTGGFTTLLDGMKAYLEYGIRLHLVEDKFTK